MSTDRPAPHWAVFALALALLNAALSIVNVWPTPFIRWRGDLSIEFMAVLAVLALGWRWALPRRAGLARGLAVLWMLLLVGRYADITAQSLWGRPINLYWDVPHLPSVGAMLTAVATPAVIAAVVGAVVLVPTLLYLPLRWAFARVLASTVVPARRTVMLTLAVLTALLGVLQRFEAGVPLRPAVVTPVTLVWAQQAMQVAADIREARTQPLPPMPVIDSDLSRVRGADVLLLFVESYGAVSWEKPAFATALAAPRRGLDEAIAATDRSVVSAYLESPTFGGESWLAHLSLLSGTEVRDGGTNMRLLAQQRDTMVTPFTRAGYRAVAVMPGIRGYWPQGQFFGFTDIYDAARLDYQGPPFGWWDVTDQYALAKVDAHEVAPAPGSRPPSFVIFPTISTHTPFSPTPPYQPDWARVLTPTPYDDAALDAAWAILPDWLDMSDGYVRSLGYAYDTFAGYLRLRADRDLMLILVGDHQPPALVSGEGASWNVPMHVITSRRDVLDRLIASGFRPGLAPQGPPISKMHAVMPTLLAAFGDPRAAGAVAPMAPPSAGPGAKD